MYLEEEISNTKESLERKKSSTQSILFKSSITYPNQRMRCDAFETLNQCKQTDVQYVDIKQAFGQCKGIFEWMNHYVYTLEGNLYVLFYWYHLNNFFIVLNLFKHHGIVSIWIVSTDHSLWFWTILVYPFEQYLHHIKFIQTPWECFSLNCFSRS